MRSGCTSSQVISKQGTRNWWVAHKKGIKRWLSAASQRGLYARLFSFAPSFSEFFCSRPWPFLIFAPSLTLSHLFPLWQVPPFSGRPHPLHLCCVPLEEEMIALVISLWVGREARRGPQEQRRMLDKRPKIMKRSRVRAPGTTTVLCWAAEELSCQ